MRIHPLSLLALVLSACFAAPIAAQDKPLPAPIAELRALLRAQDLDAAISKGEALVERAPGDALAWSWLGHAYGQRAIAANLMSKASWASKCREAYERAVALEPANPKMRFDLMQYYLQAPGFLGGGVDKAQAQAAEIARLDPASGHIAKGLLAQREKDEPGAEREYRAAIALAPAVSSHRLFLTNLLSKQMRWAELRTSWTEALAMNPEDGMAIYQLGRVSALSGTELEAGLAHIDRFLALPVKPEGVSAAAAHWRRGLILEKLGQRAAAIEEIRKAVRIDRALKEAQVDLKRLEG